MVTLVRPVQLENAHTPMEVTEPGMVTLVKPEQYSKALLPMEVTGNEIPPKVTDSGMVRSPVGLLLSG